MKDGQRVSLYVRSVSADGAARIQVAGADVIARTEMPEGSRLQAGMLLKGRVFFEDGKVCIRLARPGETASFSFSNLLASSGIAPSEAAVRALSIFYVSKMRIDPPAIRRALLLAAAFPGKEPRAAEAAALLLQKGLPLAEENVRLALAVVEGRALYADTSSRGLGGLQADPEGKGGQGARGESGGEGGMENAGGGQDEGSRGGGGFFAEFAGQNLLFDREDNLARPAWLIVPFKRELAGAECSGSIRFLAGGLGGKAIETRITVISSSLEEEGTFSADFVINEGGCGFAFSPEPGGRQAARLRAELSRALEAAGLASVAEYGLIPRLGGASSVDIKA